MTTLLSPKRPKPPAGAPGVKIFLTAASLTAIVGGWAGFTLAQAEEAPPEPAPQTVEMGLEFPPMPTLVSAPGTTAVAAASLAPLPTPRPVSLGGSGGGGSSSSSLPVRRPRQPVTRTQSSR